MPPFFIPLYADFFIQEKHKMKFSDNGINLLKRLEGHVKIGDKHVVYDDKTGIIVKLNPPLPRGATIGYGHLVKSGENFAGGIDELQATNLLRADIATSEHIVQKNIHVPLSQNQYDALVIFVYNIGGAAFAESTVVKYINNPNFHSDKYKTLESAWMAWNKSGGREVTGLTRRRIQELNLFNS